MIYWLLIKYRYKKHIRGNRSEGLALSYKCILIAGDNMPQIVVGLLKKDIRNACHELRKTSRRAVTMRSAEEYNPRGAGINIPKATILLIAFLGL